MGIQSKKKVAVLGATGIIGQTLIRLLEDHPWFTIDALVASESSAGKKYSEKCRWILKDPMPESVREMQILDTSADLDAHILFSGLDSNVAEEIELDFKGKGHVIVSNASSHRMASDVPLVIPEVNPDHLQLVNNGGKGGWIVTNPNCSAVVIALALAPISGEYGIERMYVTTMQSSSGAGYPGTPFLDLNGNVIPFIEGEEPKIGAELKKILGTMENGSIDDNPFKVSVQTNRVAVSYGHMASIFLFTRSAPDVENIKKILNNFSGLPQERKLPTAPEQPIYVEENEYHPQPRLHVDRENGMAITVGRIENLDENGIRLVALGHNTIRGGAGAALLNAELLHSEGLI
ncbi:MAG: aspartate-semialdehyde dehydrogenase [Candidatus Marinimicrobia bacterium]|nr:aspartate-semialdehyde dehydrogenase [Candidatus Neomarinimicrobiota bacterium]